MNLSRLKDLINLFFTYLKEEGVRGTIKRTSMFFKRRMRAKKGRLNPPKHMLEEQKNFCISTIENPTISVVTALFNTDILHLTQYVESFLSQTYTHKQLVLVDASDAEHSYVGEYVLNLNNKGITYIKLDENLGIAGNTNKAIEYATGSYICLADHDDILSPDALYQIAKAIQDTNCKFIYSDEALFDTDYENPIAVHFKPDYSYFYLTNCNYICHLACIEKSLFLEVGGLNSEYDGAQDHDLFLKLSEKLNGDIYHIPKVLYYWRVHQNSTSAGIAAKPYVTQNALNALNAHLKRSNINAKAEQGKFESTYKIKYELPAILPKVSILIPNKDHIDDLDKCLKSLYENNLYTNFEVIVVENNSVNRDTFDYYNQIETEYSNLKVVYFKGDFNFSAINNFGAEFADGQFYLLLNNDIEVINNDWLCEMVGIALQNNVGIVGAMLYYSDDTVQHAGVITGLGGYAGHSHKYHSKNGSGYMFRAACVQNLSAVTAAMLLVSKPVYNEMNGLDEEFAVAYNDVDFCLRVRDAGYDVVFTPYAMAYHYESKSRGLDTKGDKKLRFTKEQERLMQKHNKTILKDPFYNPNLTKDSEDFTESAVLPDYTN